MNLTNRVLFPGSAWWLLLLVPVILLGFYPTYFAMSAAPVSGLLHLHSLLMMGWVLMAVVQPLLILKRKIRAHRLVGRLSYLLMPLLLLSSWFVIRSSYRSSIVRILEVPAVEATPAEWAEAVAFAQDNMIVSVVFLLWLALFFLLGVLYRRQVVPHATFMFAAVLTLLGPSLDRIMFRVYRLLGLEFNLLAELFVFVVIILLLLLVLFVQKRNGYRLGPVSCALLLYLAGQLAIMYLPGTAVWGTVADWIL